MISHLKPQEQRNLDTKISLQIEGWYASTFAMSSIVLDSTENLIF